MSMDEHNDRDVERLIRGDATPALADAAPALARLRALRAAPEASEAARMGALLAAAAAEAAPAPDAAARVPRRFGWRGRAAVVSGLALVFAGLAGGVASADEAAPGDALYSLDRALEGLGIMDGGLEERIREALLLDQDGDVEAALEHVAQALEGLEAEGAADAEETADDDAAEDPGEDATEDAAETDADADGATERPASEALLAAAAMIRENGSEASADVHARVSEMLTWMATTEATGRDFGHGVSLRARGLHEDGEVIEVEVPEGAVDGESAVEADGAIEQPDASVDDEIAGTDEPVVAEDAPSAHGRSDKAGSPASRDDADGDGEVRKAPGKPEPGERGRSGGNGNAGERSGGGNR